MDLSAEQAAIVALFAKLMAAGGLLWKERDKRDKMREQCAELAQAVLELQFHIKMLERQLDEAEAREAGAAGKNDPEGPGVCPLFPA